jgi:hypothetical protein
MELNKEDNMDQEIMKLLEAISRHEISASDAFLDLQDILVQYGFDVVD